jgi:predicted P-loop ATPase
VISALQQSDKSTVWEELTGVEKLIIHTLKDPSEKSSLQQLIELLSVGTFHMARPLESGQSSRRARARLMVSILQASSRHRT